MRDSDRPGALVLLDEAHLLAEDPARDRFPLSSLLAAVGHVQRADDELAAEVGRLRSRMSHESPLFGWCFDNPNPSTRPLVLSPNVRGDPTCAELVGDRAHHAPAVTATPRRLGSGLRTA